MNGGCGRRFGGGMVAGVILIGLGIVFALDSLGILYAGDLFAWWPVILIGIGVTRIVQTRIHEQRIGYGILIAIGGFFLLRNLHLAWLRSRDLLPALLIVIGGLLLWQAIGRRRVAGVPAREHGVPDLVPPGGGSPGSAAERTLEQARARLAATAEGRRPPAETGSVLQEFAFMGGGDRIVRARNFRGGSVTAIMGGFHIDLRGASLEGDSAVIEVFTLWGGVDLRVPEDWSVIIQGVPLLGVFTNNARASSPDTPPVRRLVVKGTAIMGGVEVKN